MSSYFVEVDTYWQNSRSQFVGPFQTNAAATEWVESIPDDWNVWFATSTCGGDIRSAWRVYPTPLTKTDAHKRGMRNFVPGDRAQNLKSPSAALSMFNPSNTDDSF